MSDALFRGRCGKMDFKDSHKRYLIMSMFYLISVSYLYLLNNLSKTTLQRYNNFSTLSIF
jgi:hypothetical protein